MWLCSDSGLLLTKQQALRYEEVIKIHVILVFVAEKLIIISLK